MLILIMDDCAIVNPDTLSVYYTCAVCNKVVEKSEAYNYTYKDKEYFFDNTDCKKAFKREPEKYLQKLSWQFVLIN